MAPVALSPTTPPDLGPRYAQIKQRLVKPENVEAVTASWKRLLRALEKENASIAEHGTLLVPVVEWADIVANGHQLPKDIADRFKKVGTIMVKGVVSRDQIDVWFDDLVQFCKDHPEAAGYTFPNPTSWYNLFWTRPQTQARFHPNIQRLFRIMGHQFHAAPDALLDLDTQVVYGDRIRIRQPGAAAALDMHVDLSSIERWEDENYRLVYREIFEGRWEDWDPFRLDERAKSHEDLYADEGGARPTICSAFRTLQGWLALSDNKTGEGTLKVMPNLKLAIAYIMLRPLFWRDPPSGSVDDYVIDTASSKFPAAEPSYGQLFLPDEFYPHLLQNKTCVGIPDVQKGDFVFWHADVPHEVDKEHHGDGHSSVLYYGQCPLSPVNIGTMLETRRAFQANKSPLDYSSQLDDEAKAKDFQGADPNDIPNDAGRRLMGLMPLDENEAGLTPGQRAVRQLANQAMQAGSFDMERYL